MGSRPGLAEYIASFEAANNAPHGLLMLVAGVLYAVEALTDALRGRPDPEAPPALAVRNRGSGRRRRSRRFRRDPTAGQS